MRAPLNSRVVSGTGRRDKGKGKAKETSLHGVPVEIQEALVLEDLLFVLMVRVHSILLTPCSRRPVHDALSSRSRGTSTPFSRHLERDVLSPR